MGKQHLRRVSEVIGPQWLVLPLSLLMGEEGIAAPTVLVLLAMTCQTMIVTFASYLTCFWLLTRYLANRVNRGQACSCIAV